VVKNFKHEGHEGYKAVRSHCFNYSSSSAAEWGSGARHEGGNPTIRARPGMDYATTIAHGFEFPEKSHQQDI
jgi:hypothetical protein